MVGEEQNAVKKPTKRDLLNARRRERAAAKREAAKPKPKPIKFGNVRAPRRRQLTDAPVTSVFVLPSVPPGVGPDGGGRTIAMDSNIDAVNTWAQAGAVDYQFAYTEGVTFLGYPYLSQLAQRSEYRQMVETIAEECTRKWITLASSSEDENKDERIKQLSDAIDAFRIRDVVFDVLCADGYFGRAHVYVDTGDTDDQAELLTDIGSGRDKMSQRKMRRGKLRGFKVIEPVWTYPTNYNSSNPLSDDWYNPQIWFVMSQRVHVSRLLKIVARPVPDMLKPAYSFGGMSMTQIAKPYVENWLRTRQSVSDMIHRFSVSGLKTDLSTYLQSEGDQLDKRVQLWTNYQDNTGLMLLDKEKEEFFNTSTPLSTLDALQGQAQEQMCSVSRIPVVKLLGIQPAGLNASSQGELDSFGDHIHAYQERVLRSPLTTMIDFVQLSLWGDVDQSITFTFEPLAEMTEKEKAEIQKIKAETDDLLVNAQTISSEEARARVASDPDSGYNGLDPDDMPEPHDPDGDGEQDLLGPSPGEPHENHDDQETEALSPAEA